MFFWFSGVWEAKNKLTLKNVFLLWENLFENCGKRFSHFEKRKSFSAGRRRRSPAMATRRRLPPPFAGRRRQPPENQLLAKRRKLFSSSFLSINQTPENIVIFLENDFLENVFPQEAIFRETNGAWVTVDL